jgi:hypothetical protein
MLKTSKLKDNRQINDVIQVCFILESYHQRGPTHPTEDTDRLYPEDFHQRTNTSNRGYKYVVFVSFFVVVVVLNPFLLNCRILINSVVFTIN